MENRPQILNWKLDYNISRVSLIAFDVVHVLFILFNLCIGLENKLVGHLGGHNLQV